MQRGNIIMKKLTKFFIISSIFLSIVLVPFKTYSLDSSTSEINELATNETLKIEKLINNYMNKGCIPGLSVTVVKDDKTVYQKGFGYSDIESQKKIDSKSLFEIGSNSKAFTALGILALEKEGLINLEDEVTKYIPWLKVKYKGNEVRITLEQLLHHTSGIPLESIERIPVSDNENALEDTVKTLVNIELDSKPGEKFQYATINYDVLGLVIQLVKGTSYEKYIKENVLKPMGLKNTYLYKNDIVNEQIANGYKLEWLKPKIYDAPVYRGNMPAGYITSNGEDMAKWLKIQIGTLDGYQFNKDIIEESHKANRRVEPLEDGSSYAAGWFVYQRGGGEISHDGSNPNYSSFIVFRPDEKTGVAVLSNVNSAYVSAIGQGINEILQGKDYNKDIKDLNKNVDKISIFIICISVLITISSLVFMLIALKDVLKKERYLCKKGKALIVKILLSLIFMIGISYCIYLLPYIFYNGLSWEFVFVWMPTTIKLALYSLYISIWVSYGYFLIISLYKKKNDRSIFLLTILSVASGFGNALIIFTINISIVGSNEMRAKLLVYFILGIILYVYGQKIMRKQLIEMANEIVYSKRMDIVKHLLKSSYFEFEKIEKGRIQSTLNNDTETISRFANILINGLTSVVTLICCFIYLGFISIYALLLSIAIISIVSSIYYFAVIYANKIGEESRDLQNIFFNFINDLIGGFKELSLNKKRRNEFQDDMDESCKKYRVKRGKAALAFADMFVIGELLFTLAIGFVALVFPLILRDLESGNITSYVFILLYMTGPVHGILDTIPNAIEVKIGFKRINCLLEQIRNLNDGKCDELLQYNGKNINLKLNNVEFLYDENDEKNFKVGPINYEFNTGEIVFITGGNGSGKSTLTKLITGLYKPNKGYITLNNNEISEKELNEIFSTVFSDFYLFDRLYGIDYKNKQKEIHKYLEILQLSKKVNILDGKFSTTNLSTGQKKRLALLVAYLEDRSIYLFDEWAADQDPDFRSFFYNTLLPELKERGKCVIAVTHDDKYFYAADRLIKMEMGNFK